MTSPEITRGFFLESDSDQLRNIYRWARARYAAPWAVFFAVLLRVAASTGPHVQLPGVIGGRASLNLLCAFVSLSGGGKGISDKVGRLAWPTPIIELPIGSGEGIAATFMPPAKPDENTELTPRVIFNCSEIDILTGIATRQGSTILGTLKAFAMGELLGATNATKANSRNVPAHSYRGCLSVAAQPGHTGIIFDDTTGGTPQRFLWAPAEDATMLRGERTDPDPLDTEIPLWAPGIDGVVEISYGPAEITDTIIDAHIARQRGDGDALDGHWMLTRCKVAALLAVMHHRSVVSEWDWELSATVMSVSDTTRQTLLDHARQASRARIRDRAVARAAGEEFYDASRLETVKRSVLRMLERDGEQAAGELRKRLGRREKRELFDQAITLLEAEGLAVSRPGTYNGLSYTLWAGVTNAVTHENSRSECVTTAVTHEHPATVTDLDSRRSPEIEPVKLSAEKWFVQRVQQLRSGGIKTIESFAVCAEGEAVGYPRQSVIAAASRHPEVRVVARTQRGTTWCIDPTMEVTYEPVSEWISKYLDKLPGTVAQIDKKHLRSEGEAAGYTWENLRKAAREHPGVDPRPSPTSRNEHLWHIVRGDVETA